MAPPQEAALIAQAQDLLHRLFPLCRSLTGEGVRQTLAILREVADFTVYEVPSGTVAYDWVVPEEWNVREAYLADSHGRRIVDFQQESVA